jgi:hypothetical protein
MDSGMGKNDLAGLVRNLISGANKRLINGGQPLNVGGATMTVTELTQVLQRFVDNREAVESLKAALAAKLQLERTEGPGQLAVIRSFETVVRGAFGNAADALADFGLAPLKARSAMTAEDTAIAVARRQATREARHTMGKNQKKKITGSITARLVVTPVTTIAQAPAGEDDAQGP